MRWSRCATATQACSPGACAQQQEAIAMQSPCTATKSSPHSLQLEKVGTLIKKNKTKLSILGIEGNVPNLVKGICEKHIANIIFKGEKLNVFPLGSRTSQGCPLATCIQHCIRDSSQCSKNKKERKCIQIRKGEVKHDCLHRKSLWNLFI